MVNEKPILFIFSFLMAFVCVTSVFAAEGATATPSAATPTTANPCLQIQAACEDAGFKKGGKSQRVGINADCISPIMAGIVPEKPAIPLPNIDPKVLQRCRVTHPQFRDEN